MPQRRLPPTSTRLIERERLFLLVDAARTARALWVEGEAGSGKTSLLAGYLDSRRVRAVWYRVSAADTDLPTFFHYFAEAVRRAQPHGSLRLPHLTPEYLPSVAAFAKRYFATVCAAFKGPFLIVLDELQGAMLQSPLPGLLVSAIEDAPPNAFVVAVSRNAPPAAFARLLATSKLALIAAEHLRFNDDEAQALGELLGCSDASFVARCQARARGWAAGLVLVLQNRSSDHATATLSSERLLFDYFAAELFEREAPATRELLLSTALLPSLTGAEAAAVSANAHAPQLLQRLARENAFVYEDAARISYEYHPLFREFLLSRAQNELSPAALERSAHEGALVLQASGRYEAAADIYRERQEWGRLAELVLKAAPQLLAQGRWQPLGEWLSAMPPAQVESSAPLLYWKGMSQIPCAPERAREPLFLAYQLAMLTSDRDIALSACCGVLESHVAETGDCRGVDVWTQRMSELLAELPKPRATALELRLAVAFEAVRWCALHHPVMKDWIAHARGRLQETTLPPPLLFSYAYHVFSYDSWRGEFLECANTLPLLRRAVSAENAPPLLRISWWPLEVTYYCFTADLQAARDAAQDAKTLAKEYGFYNLMHAVLLSVRAYIDLCSGDPDSSYPALELAASQLPLDQPHTWHFQLLRMQVCLARNAVNDALRHSRRLLEMMSRTSVSFPHAMCKISGVQVLIEAGKHTEASALNEELRQFAIECGSAALKWMADLNDAYSALRQGDPARACECLQEALPLARAKGAVVWDIGMPTRIAARLAQAALQHGVEADYVRDVIRRRGLRPESEEIQGWPYAVRIYSLGRFEIEGDAIRHEVRRKASHQTLVLLKVLLALGGREVDAALVARHVWPGSTEEAREHNLKTTLHRLRLQLGADDAILLHDHRLSINFRVCWSDVDAFERLHEAGAASDRLAERALQLYRGPFLGTERVPGAATRRERVRQRFYRIVSEAGVQYERQAQWDGAERLYRRAIELEPLWEAFWRQLILCLKRQERNSEALDAYYRCRDVLRQELGASPSPELRALIDSDIS